MQPPAGRERRDVQAGIGVVRRDARLRLASALAAIELFLGHLLLGRSGVVDLALLAGRDVEHPEPRHRVVACARAQEGDPRAVVGDTERPGQARG